MADKIWEFELGQEVKDTVTGYKGVVMGRMEFMTGCDRFGIMQQKTKSDGGINDMEWFDGLRLQATGKKITLRPQKKVPVKQRKPGGPTQKWEKLPRR